MDKMKKLLFTMVFISIAQSTLAQNTDEAFKKDVLRLIEMSGSAGQATAAKKQLLTMIPAEKQAAFLVEFDATLPALYDNMAKIFMETYTKEDIKAMIAFYNTPVGKKMTEKSGEMAEKNMAAAQQWTQSLQAIFMKYTN